MLNKTLTLTIVIPAYNEQDYLKACLDSIAAQSVMPDQVIVVDNNSTDSTCEIAESYKFVTVIHEPNQHQSFAQKTGFDAASSDIIGRIDADSILPINWAKNIKAYFAEHPDTVGITGATLPYDISSAKIGNWGFKFYIGLASKLAGCRMLWGANCAVRRRDWEKISDGVMTRGDIWEDYDLSFCLAPHGRLESIDGIDVDSSFRSVQKPLVTQTSYQFRAARTFYHRTGLARTSIFTAVWLSLFLLFIPLMIDKYCLMPLKQALGSPAKQVAKPADIVQFEAE